MTMKTAVISHPDCSLHDMGNSHPESPERLRAIEQHFQDTCLVQDVIELEARPATREQVLRAHPQSHVDYVLDLAPEEGLVALDPDTRLCPHSLSAANLAAGSIVQACDDVMNGDYQRAFCAVRPPGHHAEADTSMGFCIYNGIAIGARHAQVEHGLERIAILDFDVHHGNGTVDIFKDDPSVLVCSSFQHPFYPYKYFDIDRPNIVNTPLESGTRGEAFRNAVERDWLPALNRHRPQLILVSAGFDAHRDDPLAGLNLLESDYAWVTDLICHAANDYSQGRVISVLEGGYNPEVLARCALEHVARFLDS
ncbi:MAG: histone deacetylase family protein [Pseudomonadales bacterium]|jgi:acetoin utilization deacetylase AcuC-like enzyme